MPLSYVVVWLWVALLVLCAVGAFLRLPVFFKRRRVAVIAFPIIFIGGAIAVLSSITPAERAQMKKEQDAKIGTWDDVNVHAGRYISMDEKYSVKYGVVSISGTLNNSSNYNIGNIRLNCRANAETGMATDKYKLTIMRTVKPNSPTKFGPLEIGSFDQQARGMDCRIVGAELLPTPGVS